MARHALLALSLTALFAAGCGADDEGDTSPPGAAPAAQLGCDQGVGELSVAPEVAAPGDTVGVEVENLSEDRVLTYGLGNELERAEGEEWAAVELPRTAVIEIALVLKPGASSRPGAGTTQDILDLPRDLEPGDYRVVKKVTSGDQAGGGQTESLTLCAPFAIEA